jgi:hypothetical protein
MIKMFFHSDMYLYQLDYFVVENLFVPVFSDTLYTKQVLCSPVSGFIWNLSESSPLIMP